MANPYVGEIRIFSGNYAVRGWLLCDGSLLPIAEYESLFELIGTTYGGDGQATFALPDLRGRAPVHNGTGGGLNLTLGQQLGTEQVALTTKQLPPHTHGATAVSNADATQRGPGPTKSFAVESNAQTAMFSTAAPDVALAYADQTVGGGAAHENMQPFLGVTYMIAYFGIFPSQN